MSVKGIFQSHQNLIGEKAQDFSGTILRYYPTGKAQFMAMSAGMPKVSTKQTSFTWYEDTHINGRVALVSATAAGLGTDITTADGSFYLPGQYGFIEETGEYIDITAVNGNVLTVTRGHAGTPVVAVVGGYTFQLLGNAHEEASSKPIAITQAGRPRTNLVQIFRNAWSMSGTMQAVELLTDNRLARSKMECSMYHSEDMERTALFGRMAVTTKNGKQRRFTDGIITQAEAYGAVVRSALSRDTPAGAIVAGQINLFDFNDFIRQLYSTQIKDKPQERIAYCGEVGLQALNEAVIADGHYNITPMQTESGIKVTKFVTPFGDLNLMTHAMLNDSALWRKDIYVLHPGGLSTHELRPTMPDNYDKSGSRNGVDADEGILTSEIGWGNAAGRCCGIYRNLQKGVKSRAQ